MKIVINTCYGGYGISALALQELAKRKGRECYFFTSNIRLRTHTPITVEQTKDVLMWSAYSVPNPDDFRLNERDSDGLYKSANERALKISLNSLEEDRTDPDLISIVEELGDEANTRFSKLKVIEIPDDCDWEINDYDGIESVIDVKRTWS